MSMAFSTTTAMANTLLAKTQFIVRITLTHRDTTCISPGTPGGLLLSTVISKATEFYRINPKVILATLQKEGSFIARTELPLPTSPAKVLKKTTEKLRIMLWDAEARPSTMRCTAALKRLTNGFIAIPRIHISFR